MTQLRYEWAIIIDAGERDYVDEGEGSFFAMLFPRLGVMYYCPINRGFTDEIHYAFETKKEAEDHMLRAYDDRWVLGYKEYGLRKPRIRGRRRDSAN